MDPNHLRSMIQMQQAMQQLTGSLPGFPAQPNPYAPPPPAGGLDFSSLLGAGGTTGVVPPAAPLVNPFMFPFMPPAAGGVPAGGVPAQPAAAPGQRFRQQLQSLQDMGFTDRSANIRALTSASGNVNRAIENLLENPPEMANLLAAAATSDEAGDDGAGSDISPADGAGESTLPKDSSEKKND